MKPYKILKEINIFISGLYAPLTDKFQTKQLPSAAFRDNDYLRAHVAVDLMHSVV